MNISKPLLQQTDFKRIAENDKYIIGSMWEKVYLINKLSNKEEYISDFYGDCTCGTISKNSDWCVVAGDIIAVWKNQSVTMIDKDELKWVHDIRQVDDHRVKILIDPWSENSAIWILDIRDFCMNKKSDFNYYRDEPFTDIVDW